MATFFEEPKIFGMPRRANNRDQAASRRRVFLEVAYRLFAKQVYGLSVRLLASERDAQEVTVAVFLKFNRELPRRWDESRVLERLRELAMDEALRRWRKHRGKRRKIQAPEGHSLARNFNANSAKGDRVGASLHPLDSEKLAALTNMLPDDLLLAFVLHDMEGLSNQALARHLRSDETTVRRLVSQARMELRRLWVSTD